MRLPDFLRMGRSGLPFGRRAEIEGAFHLRRLGFRLRACPYRIDDGEVDIVAEEGGALVFVEVKARRRDSHPEDAVTPAKRRRLIRAARHYRSRYGLTGRPWRYDILAVIEPPGRPVEYRLLRDAFRETPGRGTLEPGAGVPI